MDALPSRVRTFVAASALEAGDGASQLRAWYEALPGEGWLVELARAHGRALLGRWTHDEFAAWLGLRGEELGGAYRQMLRLGDADREEATDVARRVLERVDADGVAALQRAPEMVRFRRAREGVERRQRLTTRPVERQATSGPRTRAVEDQRMELRASVDEWSAALGMSGPTYLARLLKEGTGDGAWRDKVDALARDAATLHRRMAVPIVARRPPVTRQEIEGAYGVVAEDLEDLRATLLQDAAPPPPEAPDGEFLKLDLYSWLRQPEPEETA